LLTFCVHAARPTAHHQPIASPLRQAYVGHNAQPMLQSPPPPDQPGMTLSTSCPHQLDSRFLESSLDSLQLTQMEIDAIRNMGRPGSGSGASSASTPTSQLSHPDFVDPRPDIYRFVYDISPGTRSHTSESASVSGEGGDGRPPESQHDSKFDEIVIASMEHPSGNRHMAQGHKVKDIASGASEATAETLSKHAAGHSNSESLPAFSESTTSPRGASEQETHTEAMAALAQVQSNEIVVSVGDALVVRQSSELTPSKSSREIQHQPVTAASSVADMPSASTSKLQDVASARIHKGSCMHVFSFIIPVL